MASGGNIAGQIDGFLKSYGSPMAGLGSLYAAAGKKYGVDPRLAAAISIAESSGGKKLYGSFNAWGWGPGNSFSSWEDGISTVTRGLRRGYLDQGLTTPATIVSKWAPASDGNNEQHWSQTVSEYMRKMGASPAISMALASTAPASTPTISTPTAEASSPMIAQLQSQLGDLMNVPRSTAGLQQAALANLSSIARTGYAQPTSMLSDFTAGLQSDLSTNRESGRQRDALSAALQGIRSMSPADKPPTAEKTASTDVTTPSTVPAPPVSPANVGKWAKLAGGADRSGVTTHPSVLSAVARIAQLFGSPLTITTGTNHNQFVAGHPGRESQHWQGNAADILYGHGTGPDNVDPALTHLGRVALIAAGMDPKEAAKINGGAYNVGGWNILFNTGEGGNHYNHLHVGV